MVEFLISDPEEWLETVYRCTECNAEDRDRSAPSSKPPMALSCWQCGAGYGKDLGTMGHQKLGMFPVPVN